MGKKQNIFDSSFVIDGVLEALTPSELLRGSLPSCPPGGASGQVFVDESIDPMPVAFSYNPDRIRKYLSLTRKTIREFPTFFSGAYTTQKIAASLLELLPRKGHFRLEDLSVKAIWRWNDSRMGNMAAFYESVMQAADCLDALSLPLLSYKAEFPSDSLGVDFVPLVSKNPSEAEEDLDYTAEKRAAVIGTGLSCPRKLVPDLNSWIIYIPFDTVDYHLGGSLLNQALGIPGGGRAPELTCADYFRDCYEVVREFVEDGLLLSACRVGDGGLLTALDSMTGTGVGALADVSDLLRANPSSDPVRVLFSEIPGVVIQIRDSDFDYTDAELLLQDVAYYPLGHPTSKSCKVEICSGSGPGIQNILDSLISR